MPGREPISGAVHAEQPSMRIYGVINITSFFYFLVVECGNKI
jgi:hypothetical protein